MEAEIWWNFKKILVGWSYQVIASILIYKRYQENEEYAKNIHSHGKMEYLDLNTFLHFLIWNQIFDFYWSEE